MVMILKKEVNEKLQMLKFLQYEGKGVDVIVFWFDCDKEGENICFEVLDCVRFVMNKRLGGKIVFCVKFFVIIEIDICGVMYRLSEFNKNEVRFVDVR